MTGWMMVIALWTLLPGCEMGIVGNGVVQSQERDIKSFSRLEIGGNFNLFLKQGRKPALKFEMDENLFDNLQVNQYGKTLSIQTERNVIRAKKKNIYLTVRDLEKMDLSGAIKCTTQEVLKIPSLVVIGSGAVELNMELQSKQIKLDLSGASNCQLQGKTKLLTLTLAGAGDFNALDLISDEVSIDLSGAGSAKVFAQDKLDVQISGVGSVKYRGDPVIEKEVSGLGSLKRY